MADPKRDFEVVRLAHEVRLSLYVLVRNLITSPPTLELLHAISHDPALHLLAEDVPFLEELLAAAHAAQRQNQDQKHILSELEEEYRRLYVGPGALPSPLWESVYRDPEHILFGETTLKVRAFYARYGLASPLRASEPEDHITHELEFMVWLIHRVLDECASPSCSQESLRQWIQGQTEFLEHHLLQWAPQSFTLQQTAAQTPLYAALARLLVDFLPHDLSLLKELAGALYE